MSGRYDAVVVGGGHNGLVAATYRARGGLRVPVLERRDPGGEVTGAPGHDAAEAILQDLGQEARTR